MWTPPPGNLILDRPPGTEIPRPADVVIPPCKTEKPTPDYLKELDRSAWQYEKDSKYHEATYLYGLLVKESTFFYPKHGFPPLYARAKLSECMFQTKKSRVPVAVARDALVIADQLKREKGDDKLLFRAVRIAAQTIFSVANRNLAGGHNYELIYAKNNFQHAATYLTKILGSDHELTKPFTKKLAYVEARINIAKDAKSVSETQPGSKQAPSQPAQKNNKDFEKPEKQWSTKQIPNRSKTPQSEDNKEQSVENSKEIQRQSASDVDRDSLLVPKDGKILQRSQSNSRETGPADSQSSLSPGEGPKRSKSSSHLPKKTGRLFDGESSTEDSKTPFEWSEEYEDEEGYENALQETHDFFAQCRGKYPKGNDKSTRRVRIAVLDTGIDLSRIKKGKKQIKKHQSFIPGLDKGNEDHAGHGTNIVLLLLDICPMAEIYVYRVFRHETDVNAIDAIVPALKQAVEDEVDIINMSFGFQGYQPEMASEIAIARAKGIHMFAAASNSGARAALPIAWPAARFDVYCIYATDINGNPYDNNPPTSANKPNFATLGVNVRPSQCISTDLSLSGTSFAAPIAAATAALFIDFTRLAPTDDHKFQKLFSSIHEYESMEALLRASSLRGKGGLSYIKPWAIFSGRYFDRAMVAHKLEEELSNVHRYNVH